MSNRVSVKVSGVKDAVKALQKRTMKYTEYFGKVLHNALTHGARSARSAFNGANTNKGVNVHVEKAHAYGSFVYCRLDADGDAVVFLEFGAGDATGQGEHGEEIMNFTEETGISVLPGSYSSTVGSGEYVNNALANNGEGWWHFNGQIFTAIEPRRGMYKAKQQAVIDLADTRSKAYTNAESTLNK